MSNIDYINDKSDIKYNYYNGEISNAVNKKLPTKPPETDRYMNKSDGNVYYIYNGGSRRRKRHSRRRRVTNKKSRKIRRSHKSHKSRKSRRHHRRR
uniref:Uncharacterized protein n=1 Tax=viral metagenome TaxID=1070528 RepID=A0A6C0EV19_9ZZZZ